jgi:hypothetical protein
VGKQQRWIKERERLLQVMGKPHLVVRDRKSGQDVSFPVGSEAVGDSMADTVLGGKKADRPPPRTIHTGGRKYSIDE